jgi:two-component system, OmpR family, response regulator MtrA
MCARVLIAEDDVHQAEVIRRYVVREGHEATVVHDGLVALAEARRQRPDVIVLDVMMPSMNGLDVCGALRREHDSAAVLLLTARSTEDDMLLGLDAGADDYLTKPYSPRVLVARIRALLRRSGRERGVPDGPVLRAGPLTVDPLRHQVALNGHLVACTPGEFAILAALAEHPERVFTRGQLLGRTRGSDQFISERVVDVHVLNLRKKIEADPGRPQYLVTVFGIGYKLTRGLESGRER